LRGANGVWYHLLPSSLGDVGILWQGEGKMPSVIGIVLPHPDMTTAEKIHAVYPGVLPRSHANLSKTCEEVGRFLEGIQVEFSFRSAALDRLRGFQGRVLRETARIPRGNVTSYGTLAEAIHAPRAARAVGTALARNPFPLIIPCHRVVKADGFIGRFGGGREMKKALLRLEGVEIDDGGRVPPAFFR
jgi:methylated-DNA-[protein]-cysteine S-methyltransferase